MTRTSIRLSVCFLLICCALPLMAQSVPAAESVVPALVKFTGTLSDADGKPLTGTVGVTFFLYKEQTGGAPLWMETQNVLVDKNGHFSAMLGLVSAHGLPPEMFVAGEARWLGVQASGQAEQARTLLLSVPYALKALDAETLGGKPASFFMSAAESKAGGAPGAGPGQAGPQVEQKNEIICSSPTNCKTSFVPLFTTSGGSAQVSDSIISQGGSGINVQGNEIVTSNINGPAILATSTGTSGTSNGVQGVTSSATASGVAGINTSNASGAIGVYGSGAGYGVVGTGLVGVLGSSTASHGVYGETTSPGAYGVVGLNNATGGIGVLGSAPNGDGFYTVNNVYQDRSAGGWVKAMAYVSGFDPGRIVSCFNSTLIGAPATIPPCGFSISKLGTGDYILDFGFQIDDRFYSVSTTNWFTTTGLCTDWNGACNGGPTLTPNQAQVFSFQPSSNSYTDVKFYVTIY